MALNGINSSQFQSSNNQQIQMPFESPLLRKLAYSKLVDATMQKVLISKIIKREVMQKIKGCIQSK
jgi:hypothetical protein